jgi:hypothetical protein
MQGIRIDIIAMINLYVFVKEPVKQAVSSAVI